MVIKVERTSETFEVWWGMGDDVVEDVLIRVGFDDITMTFEDWDKFYITLKGANREMNKWRKKMEIK